MKKIRTETELLSMLHGRQTETGDEILSAVNRIINDVKQRGDAAVLEYTNRFDCKCDSIKVICKDEISAAADCADKDFLTAIYACKRNIEEYHKRQKVHGFSMFENDGIVLGQIVRGLSRVGLYVPGGTAFYPSSVLMNAIPAKIAGVEEIVMVTPPGKDGGINKDILTAAAVCGIDTIYLVGGAQAVAALSYGTKTIKRVDKIVGPGNIYVATAKKLLYGVVDIDMIAGPSEILIIADENANPTFVAADLLSQAEHDVLAASILVTTSEHFADKVIAEANRLTELSPRRDIIRQSLDSYGCVVLCQSEAEMFDAANRIAPEHLEIMLPDPITKLPLVKNAGSVFLGEYSPEPLGDYYAGPNHVLPTNGTARFHSPLSVDSFCKKMSYIHYGREALQKAADHITTVAEREGLLAHANSVKLRMES